MPTRKKRILVCDDDADLVAQVSTLLEAAGYEVETAYNGRECVESVLSRHPDLVVLDVMMANLSDGFEASRELRNCELTKQVPIVMVTAINKKADLQFSPDDTWLPVDSFIDKPADPARLLAEIRRLLAE
jgi:two-component system alkaline phosphatase synthesis response regulator PhoP